MILKLICLFGKYFRKFEKIVENLQIVFGDKAFSKDYEPAEEEVEEADGVHGEFFAVFWDHFFDEVDTAIGGPDECEPYVQDSYNKWAITTNEKVENCDQC